jgi:hypothetical protein
MLRELLRSGTPSANGLASGGEDSEGRVGVGAVGAVEMSKGTLSGLQRSRGVDELGAERQSGERGATGEEADVRGA